jgi:hypothetical protein
MKALLAYAGTQPTSVAGCVLSVEASVLWLLISGCCAQREGVGGKVTNVDVRLHGRLCGCGLDLPPSSI